MKSVRLSRDQVLTLMERLAKECLSFRVDLWAYGTHEGDSSSRVWRGPIAYELHVGGSAPPTVLDSGYMTRLGEIAHEYGLEAYLSSDDGAHQIKLVPKKDSEYDWTRVFASDLRNGVGLVDET